MVDVVVLGSGTPVPDPDRAGSALAVVAEPEWVLVDCGRAATQRAVSAGLDLTALVAVAITHHHSDHVSDLATVAMNRWSAGATTPLVVLAPRGPAARFARRCLDVFDDQSFYSQAPSAAGSRPVIDTRPFDASDELAVVFASAGWRLSSVLVDHHPVEPAVGYLVEHTGTRVAVSGDTTVCEGMRTLSQDVHVLVHEALLTSRVSPGLLAWNAGAVAVGELAAQTHPRTLVVTHMIPAPSTSELERAYLEEIRAGGFHGPIHLAYDGIRITAT